MARADTTRDLFGDLDTLAGGDGGFGGALDALLGQVTSQAHAPRPLDWFNRGGDAGAGPTGGGPLDRLLSGIRAGANALPDVPIWGGAFGDTSLSGKKTTAAQQRDGEVPVPGAAPAAAPSGAAGTPGAGWGAPSAQQLDAELAGSPLAGQGATIASIAAQHGVPVTVAMGILRQESSYGRNASGYNYGGLMNADGSHTLAQFGSVAEGLEAIVANMGSALYRGKTISQFMNTYAPPDDGNDTNAYINNILTLDHKWGGHSDWNTVVTGNAPATPQAGPSPQGAGGGMASIWGGGNAGITQEYGAVTPGIDQGIYGYGAAYGLPQGHTGLDVGLKRGTQLYLPAGLSGTVTTAGGTPYFRDEDYGDAGTPGKGELRITLSNGDILILGHTSQIGVGVGQQVTGGTLLGLSGSASGDHLHLEVRQRQADGSYRLVDPRAYFGGR